MTNETVEFLPALPGEPNAEELLFGLRGVTHALQELAIVNDDDRDHIADLSLAAEALAKLLVHRMNNTCAEAIEADGEATA